MSPRSGSGCGSSKRRLKSTASSHSPVLLEVSFGLTPTESFALFLDLILNFCVETCGGAPPEDASSDTVDLAAAVGFLDRVCAYA